MTIGRIIKRNGSFEFIELEELEQEEVIRNAIDRNLHLYMRIEKAVHEYLMARHFFNDELQKRIALAIFEALAIRTSTLLWGELRRKIHLAKEG